MNAIYTFGGDAKRCNIVENHTNGYITIRIPNNEEKLVHHTYVTTIAD